MIRTGLSSLLAGLIILIAPSGAPAEDSTPRKSHAQGINSATQEAAERGLKILHDLAKAEINYETYATTLGFTSVQQAAQATIGHPLPVYRVHILKLADYQEGNRVDAIFFETHPQTTLIPILADGETRSSFMIVGAADRKSARIIGQGASNFVVGYKPGYLETMDAVVLIPDLRLRFFARDTDAGFILIPIKDSPLFQLKAGEALQAEKLFTTLAPIARRVAQAIADTPEPEKPRNP